MVLEVSAVGVVGEGRESGEGRGDGLLYGLSDILKKKKKMTTEIFLKYMESDEV